jgi:arsenical pump membrane protein
MSPQIMTWIIAAAMTACIIVRPFNLPEFIWAVAAAALLLVLGLISPPDALAGMMRGTDVYLFLIGMMLLAEIAREEGLFVWLAAIATRRAEGSAHRLFLLTYIVGTVVTILLSNDATAVVLTPAVAAAVRAAKAEQPLPYLLICAIIANAASFVLPISNPANLVIYGAHMPPLLLWLRWYLLPSAVSIVVTYLVLRWTQRSALRQPIAKDVPVPALSAGGKTAAAGIVATAGVLLAASVAGVPLGLTTALAGVVTAAIVLIRDRKGPWRLVKDISWSVLPLVAGLFVLVEAIERTGFIRLMTALLHRASDHSTVATAWGAGIIVALLSNLMNNLPVGLVAGSMVQNAHLSNQVARTILIGVDLGPNLSVTGSLATILWIAALRREGQSVGALAFLQLGVVVMLSALLPTIAAAVLVG